MKELIFNFTFWFGSILGALSLIIPPQLSYLVELLKNGFYTMRYKRLFKTKGKRIVLAQNIKFNHPQCIEIGNDISIAKFCIFETYNTSTNDPLISIGSNCHFGEYTHITCINRIIIGDGLLTGRFVLITDNAHGETNRNNLSIPPLKRSLFSKGPVIIGKNVWIGDKVTILPDVKIGDGAIIAAGAVVIDDIPPYTVAGGVPAKVLKDVK